MNKGGRPKRSGDKASYMRVSLASDYQKIFEGMADECGLPASLYAKTLIMQTIKTYKQTEMPIDKQLKAFGRKLGEE